MTVDWHNMGWTAGYATGIGSPTRALYPFPDKYGAEAEARYLAGFKEGHADAVAVRPIPVGKF